MKSNHLGGRVEETEYTIVSAYKHRHAGYTKIDFLVERVYLIAAAPSHTQTHMHTHRLKACHSNALDDLISFGVQQTKTKIFVRNTQI